ncbi:hypothetical protein [Streptomyces sp. CB00455]|uniref:hypothetical protein n=1 Tax=Streptomyces sp. CB00455 TaxID=1703927 RepID=UPI0011611608|nr:hypothetical protein [Streptomyces sp. CB00455]
MPELWAGTDAGKAEHHCTVIDTEGKRRKITTNALSILTAVIMLREVQVPDGVTDTLRAALAEERDRWHRQVGEATRHFTDRAQEFIFTFRGPIGVLWMRYCGTARMVWISDRTEETRLRHLLEITEHFHTLFFGSRWRLRSRVRAMGELQRLMSVIEEEGRPPLPQSRTAPAVEV